MTKGPEPGAIRVGDWALDPVARTISRDDVTHRLEPKMVDVLMLLIEHRGEVVEREVIERSVWSGAAVGGDLLNRTIWKLRRVLDDDPSAPVYVETIPRTGYRLVASVGDAPELLARDAPKVPAGAPPWRVPVMAGLAAIAVAGAAFVASRSGRVGSGIAERDLVSTPLTSGAGYEANPSVSPDGRYAAFDLYDPSGPQPSWDVATVDLESHEVMLVASEPGVHEYAATWAPAGDSVAFVRSGERCTIFVQALAGAPEEVAACAADQWHELAWLPDGDLVLASSAPGQTLGLELVRRGTGQRERLTVPPSGFDGDRLPRVSPDGRRLAFVRQRTDGVADIYVMDLAAAPAGAPRSVTSDSRRIAGLSWDPTGAALLFSSRRGGGDGVWRIPVAGGTPSPIPLVGRNAGPLSAGVGALVYEEYTGDSDLWTYDPRTGQLEPWHGSSRSEWGAAVSPDGRTVAFVSNRTGGDEIWSLPIGGGEPVRLTRLEGAEVDGPRWHRGGDRLVFASTLHGTYDLFVADVGSGTVERITDSPDDERNPLWWGDTIVYSANRTGTRELWVLDVRRGTSRRLTSGGGWVARESGRGILFTRPTGSGVWRLTDAESEPEPAWHGIGIDEGTNWLPSGTGMLLLRAAGGAEAELVRLDDPSGEPRRLAAIPREISGRGGVAELPDGRVLFSVIVRSESDLWVAR